jgi:hypothetical protein
MKRLVTVILLISQCLAAAAFADCRFEGKTYKTGQKAAGATCQEDGTWK